MKTDVRYNNLLSLAYGIPSLFKEGDLPSSFSISDNPQRFSSIFVATFE
jgi:hypothetical protein